MKIVFVVTDLSIGGAQVMLLKLVTRLDRRIAPHVISLTTVGEIGARIEALGVPVEALGMRPGRLGINACAGLWRRLRALAPRIVQTWMYHADLLGGIAARAAGLPSVAWGIRNSDLDARWTKLSTRMTVRACAALSHRVPDRILCCSETARQIHEHLGYASGKFVVIPNGFELDRFRPQPDAAAALRRELALPADALLVGMVGRRNPQKNHEALFRVASELRALLPTMHLVLAGTGIDAGDAALVAAARDAGMLSNTRLLGQRADMPGVMAALDLLVSCSAYGEAFPNVLGEAMACGVPCVATDVGDSAHIVGDTGRVVPRNDDAALRYAITELLLMPAQARSALGLRARARIASQFEIGAVVRRYESFYEDLGNAA